MRRYEAWEFGSYPRAIAGIEALLGQLLMALLVFVLTLSVTWSN